MEASAFRRCSSITAFTIPGNVKILRKNCLTSENLSELILSYGIEEVSSDSIGGGSLSEVVFPESVYSIGALGVNWIQSASGERFEIYITNDDCALGAVNHKDTFTFDSSWDNKDVGAIASLGVWEGKLSNSVTKIHIYGLKDGSVKQYVKDYMSDQTVPQHFAVFHGISADELADKNEYCKTNGILEPNDKNNDKDQDKDNDNDGDDKDNSDTDEDKTSNKNTNSDSEGMESMMKMMMMFMFGLVGLIIIAVIVIVIIVVLKKKKKKKKKKKVAEAPIEEVSTEEVSTEEVPTEETPVEEVPAGETPIEEIPDEKGEEE